MMSLRIWELLFFFSKTKTNSQKVQAKDLKCSGKRYEQAQELNFDLIENTSGDFLPAIERYSGVMYTAIAYAQMEKLAQEYFQNHFLILSWMYGLLHPLDQIKNYKLPIEARWLADFWKKKIYIQLNALQADIIIDMLPQSYKKMIDWKKLDAKILRIEFFQGWKKLSHGVKKIKWQYISCICHNQELQIPDFWDIKEYILKIEL